MVIILDNKNDCNNLELIKLNEINILKSTINSLTTKIDTLTKESSNLVEEYYYILTSTQDNLKDIKLLKKDIELNISAFNIFEQEKDQLECESESLISDFNKFEAMSSLVEKILTQEIEIALEY